MEYSKYNDAIIQFITEQSWPDQAIKTNKTSPRREPLP